jgi:hypothetical protein
MDWQFLIFPNIRQLAASENFPEIAALPGIIS